MVAYLTNLLVMAGLFAMLAASLNVMFGYAGIFSVAHAVFFGVGAYTASLVALHGTDQLVVAAPAAMLAAGAAALLLAVPALRVKEEYFVVAALGFQIVASTVFSEWYAVTGGMGGLTGIPPARLGGATITSVEGYLVLTLGCLAAVLAAIALLVHSPFGRALKALRDDEEAARALGKDPVGLRLVAVVVSGALAGLAGALYAFYVSFVNPETFTLDQSVLVMAMVILGGAGTLAGPVLGALFITLFPALLSFLDIPGRVMGPVQQIVYGLAMVLLMIYRPDGLVGLWRRAAPRARRAAGDREEALRA